MLINCTFIFDINMREKQLTRMPEQHQVRQAILFTLSMPTFDSSDGALDTWPNRMKLQLAISYIQTTCKFRGKCNVSSYGGWSWKHLYTICHDMLCHHFLGKAYLNFSHHLCDCHWQCVQKVQVWETYRMLLVIKPWTNCKTYWEKSKSLLKIFHLFYKHT